MLPYSTLYCPVVYQLMVEHSAVNRVVVGSSPTRGVKPAVSAADAKSL